MERVVDVLAFSAVVEGNEFFGEQILKGVHPEHGRMLTDEGRLDQLNSGLNVGQPAEVELNFDPIPVPEGVPVIAVEPKSETL